MLNSVSMIMDFLKWWVKITVFLRIFPLLNSCVFSQRAYLIEISRFQNEFMKTSFLPKHEPNIVKISALYLPHYRVEILTIFVSYCGRNDDFINSF